MRDSLLEKVFKALRASLCQVADTISVNGPCKVCGGFALRNLPYNEECVCQEIRPALAEVQDEMERRWLI